MQATIDRIEKEVAVLVTCGEDPSRLTLPAWFLPPGSREGDIVSIAITPDRAATDAAKDRISRKIDRLRDLGLFRNDR